MLHFSASTGQGKDEVIQTIMTAVEKVEERAAGSLFRMPLDRVFTMKGFGTVVTGTAISGRLSLGDTVMVYPGEQTAKVRGLQVHNESMEFVGRRPQNSHQPPGSGTHQCAQGPGFGPSGPAAS